MTAAAEPTRSRAGCAGKPAPIAAADPAIDDMRVTIRADHPEIPPDGQVTITVRAACGGVPIEGAEIALTVEPQPYSGGHIHTAKRPRGTLNGIVLGDGAGVLVVKTGGDGRASARFEPPGKTPKSRNIGIAGLYEIAAKAVHFPERVARLPVSVRFTDLEALPESPDAFYDVSRNSAESHPHGISGTAGTIRAFKALAEDFYQAQLAHNDALKSCGRAPWPLGKVSYNDIALPDGGLFDWKGNWAPPHQTHGKGRGGDVNHFFATGTLPVCDGASVPLDAWLTTVLLRLGTRYGQWDRSDFVLPQFFLHLHVED